METSSSKIFHSSCTICRHPLRDEIHRLRMMERKTYEEIMEKINIPGRDPVSVAALSRHFNHIDEYVGEHAKDIVLDGLIKDIQDAKRLTIDLAGRAYSQIVQQGNLADVKLYAIWYQMIKLAFLELEEKPTSLDANQLREIWKQQKVSLGQSEAQGMLPLGNHNEGEGGDEQTQGSHSARDTSPSTQAESALALEEEGEIIKDVLVVSDSEGALRPKTVGSPPKQG